MSLKDIDDLHYSEARIRVDLTATIDRRTYMFILICSKEAVVRMIRCVLYIALVRLFETTRVARLVCGAKPVTSGVWRRRDHSTKQYDRSTETPARARCGVFGGGKA